MGLLINFYLKKSGQNRLDLKLWFATHCHTLCGIATHVSLSITTVTDSSTIKHQTSNQKYRKEKITELCSEEFELSFLSPRPQLLSVIQRLQKKKISELFGKIFPPVISQKTFIEVQYTLNYHTWMSCCSSSHYPSYLLLSTIDSYLLLSNITFLG